LNFDIINKKIQYINPNPLTNFGKNIENENNNENLRSIIPKLISNQTIQNQINQNIIPNADQNINNNGIDNVVKAVD